MSKLILEAETHRILGACFEVYKEKGCGFVEPVYQECLWSEAILDGQFRTARLSQRRSFLVCFRVLSVFRGCCSDRSWPLSVRHAPPSSLHASGLRP